MKLKTAAAALALAAMLNSCVVDKQLDFKKNLDTKVTVVPGMAVSLGNAGTVRTGIILDGIVYLNNAVPSFRVTDLDPYGNFAYSENPAKIENKPLITDNITDGTDSDTTFVRNVTLAADGSAAISLVAPVEIAGTPHFSDGAVSVRNIETLPFGLTLTFAVNRDDASPVTIKKGMRFTFPDFLTPVEATGEGVIYQVSGRNAILADDITVEAGKKATVNISVKATTPSGEIYSALNPVRMRGMVTADGDISFPTGGGSAASLACGAGCSTRSASIGSAEVYVDGTVQLNDATLNLALLNLTRDYLLPTDVELKLKSEAAREFQMDLNGTMKISDEQGNALCEYGFGAKNGKPMTIPAGAQGEWTLSTIVTPDEGTSYRWPASPVNIPDLLLKEKVSTVTLTGLTMTPAQAVWIPIDSKCGNGGLFSGNAKFYLPVTIGNGVNSELGCKLGHFGVDTTFTIEEMTPVLFDMDIDNSTPITFKVAAELVDKEGNVVKHYEPLLNFDITGGNTINPGKSKLRVGFTTREIVPFDGIRISLTVESVAAPGMHLNRQQGLTFGNMRIVTPEGITFDPNWLDYLHYLLDIKKVYDDVIEIIDLF